MIQAGGIDMIQVVGIDLIQAGGIDMIQVGGIDMIQLSEQDRAAISRRVAYALSICGEGNDAGEILSGIYCEFMPGRSEYQGRLVANRIFALMSEYENHEQAVQDVEQREYLASQLYRLIRKKSLTEQCGTLYLLTESMKSMDMDVVLGGLETADRKNYVERYIQRAGRMAYRGEISERARDRLLVEAAETLSDAVPELSVRQMKRELREGTDVGAAALYAKLDRSLVTAVIAVVVYTMQQRGELQANPLSEKPEQDLFATLEQAVLLACHDERVQQLYDSYQKKAISYRQLNERLGIIWTVTLTLLLSILIAGGAAAVWWAHNSVAALGIAIGTVILSGVLYWQANASMTGMVERVSAKLSDLHMRLPASDVDVRHSIDEWRGRQEDVMRVIDAEDEEDREAEHMREWSGVAGGEADRDKEQSAQF